MMETFKRKPMTVKAVQWDGDIDYPEVRLIENTIGSPMGILNGDIIVPGQWIVRTESRTITMSDKDFRREYEPA